MNKLRCPKCNGKFISEQHTWFSNSNTRKHQEYKLICVKLCGFETRYYKTLKYAESCFKRTDWSRKKL